MKEIDWTLCHGLLSHYGIGEGCGLILFKVKSDIKLRSNKKALDILLTNSRDKLTSSIDGAQCPLQGEI